MTPENRVTTSLPEVLQKEFYMNVNTISKLLDLSSGTVRGILDGRLLFVKEELMILADRLGVTMEFLYNIQKNHTESLKKAKRSQGVIEVECATKES